MSYEKLQEIMKEDVLDDYTETPSFKFQEDRYLKEFQDYISETYRAHYSISGDVQFFDLLHAAGRSEDFIIGSILKYASRFGRKNGNNRKDILKIVHYCLLLLWVMDQKNKEELGG